MRNSNKPEDIFLLCGSINFSPNLSSKLIVHNTFAIVGFSKDIINLPKELSVTRTSII